MIAAVWAEKITRNDGPSRRSYRPMDRLSSLVGPPRSTCTLRALCLPRPCKRGTRPMPPVLTTKWSLNTPWHRLTVAKSELAGCRSSPLRSEISHHRKASGRLVSRTSPWRLVQPQRVDRNHDLRPIADLQCSENSADVPLHGWLGQIEHTADCLVALPLHDQS